MKDSIKKLFESDNPTNHQLAYELCKGLNMDDYDIGMLIINNWLHFERWDSGSAITYRFFIKDYKFEITQFYKNSFSTVFYDKCNCEVLPIYYYFYNQFYNSRTHTLENFKRVISLLIRNIFNDKIKEEW